METASPTRGTSGRRQAILNLLRDHDVPMEISEIAEALDVHANTVRFHLNTLLAQGQVTRALGEHDRPGRPAQLFSAARVMNPDGPQHYQLLAEILAAGLGADLDPQQGALEAGRRWGQQAVSKPESLRQAAVPQLVDVLKDLDFAPEVIEGKPLPVIGLRHCPFLDLARSRPEVVCSVHLGLMQGVLESAGASVSVARLEPFAEPDLCAAHLVPSARPRRPNRPASRR